MSYFLARSLAFACAVLMTLPPGWCCVQPSVHAPDPARTPRGGCWSHQSQSAEPEPTAPVQPCSRCDCETTPTFAPAPEVPNLPAAADGSFLAVAERTIPGSTGPAGPGFVFDSPPLLLLQCVWRC